MIQLKYQSLIPFLIATLTAPSAMAADPPGKQLSLNDRVFLNTTTVYDPTYGLSRVGVIKDHVLTWLPLNKNIRNYPQPKIISRNFVVYNAYSDEGGSASVSISIPVVGAAGSASSDKIVYANLEDFDEVTAPNINFSACQIWALIPHGQVSKGDTVVLTDHAILSKLQYGTADKQQANASASAGGFFGVGASLYKMASNDTKVPMIAVEGTRFVVPDPATFCKGRLSKVPDSLVKFKGLRDLGEPNLHVAAQPQ